MLRWGNVISFSIQAIFDYVEDSIPKSYPVCAHNGAIASSAKCWFHDRHLADGNRVITEHLSFQRGYPSKYPSQMSSALAHFPNPSTCFIASPIG